LRHFLLFYQGAPDYRERRAEVRAAHLARWHVPQWTTVVGKLAATPVRPEDL